MNNLESYMETELFDSSGALQLPCRRPWRAGLAGPAELPSAPSSSELSGEISSALFYKQDDAGSQCLHMS